MTGQPCEPLITCPRCDGQGETPLERRRVRVGMNVFWEYGCTACHASGRLTEAQYRRWLTNRQHPVQRAYLRESEAV